MIHKKDSIEKTNEGRVATPSTGTENRDTERKQPGSMAMSKGKTKNKVIPQPEMLKIKKKQLAEKLAKAYIGLNKLKQKRAKKKESHGKFKKAKFNLSIVKGEVVLEKN